MGLFFLGIAAQDVALQFSQSDIENIERAKLMKATHRIINFSFIVLAVISIAGCANPSYKKHYADAVAYASQGNLEIANKEFKRSLEIYRFFSPSIRSGEIIDDMNQGKIEQETVALFIKGISYANQRLFKQAINEYSLVIENSPEYALAYESRGSAYIETGEYDLAINDFNTAITLESQISEAYVNRGVAYVGKSQYELAMQDYQKAIELDPNLDFSYVNLGLLYQKQNQLEKAIHNYTLALNVNGRNADAYYGRANALRDLGKYDLAIRDYNEAIKINRDVAVYYSNRGNVHLVKLGHPIMGCLDLQNACKLGECKYYNAAVKKNDC